MSGTVAVFGANGPTGRELVGQLLDRGFSVRAVTRNPGQFGEPGALPPRLAVVRADATDPAQVGPAVDGTDAVASVLGTSFTRRPVTLYSASARTILSAMAATGTRRLVVTSSMAAVDWRDPRQGRLERAVMEQVLLRIGRTLYQDMRRMEDVVGASATDWTIVRPLGLASMPPPTEYRVARDHIGGRQTARRDLAAAIADRVERGDFVRAAVAVATTNRSESLPVTIWREGIRPNLPHPRRSAKSS